ncbi:MAG: HAD family hydrolase [Phycisphaerales bacterium]|nr:HAD family hydrolase [Phycisphaerales bacterium]
MHRPTPPSAVIFDLDGTLVDSLQDIAEAMNECLRTFGLPDRPISDYRYLVGEGVPVLCQRVLTGANPHLLDALIQMVRSRYRERPLLHTRPYPGVAELVNRLRAAGVPLGVLSNKPDEMTRLVTREFWPDGVFGAVQGYVEEHLRKPDPTQLLRMCAALGARPVSAWLVGDTPTDVETAARAGVHSVAVTWGFRTREDLAAAGAVDIVDEPEQVF